MEAESLGNVVADLEQAGTLDPMAATLLTTADPRRIDQLAGGVCAMAEEHDSWDDLTDELGRLHDELTADERQDLTVDSWLMAAGVLLGFFCPDLVPPGEPTP